MPGTPLPVCQRPQIKQISSGEAGDKVNRDLEQLYAAVNALTRCAASLATAVTTLSGGSFDQGSGSVGSSASSGTGSISVLGQIVAGSVPHGTIAIWTGMIADIPSGWVICDGTNGTPDLQGIPIIGAGPDVEAGPVTGS